MVELRGQSIYLYYQASESNDPPIRIAKSEDGLTFEFFKKAERISIKKEKYERIKPLVKARADKFDNGEIEIEGIFEINKGYLVVYHSKDKWGDYKVGTALFAKGKTTKLTWRGDSPLWESSTKWTGNNIEFIGLVYLDGRLISYWGVDEKEIYVVIYPSFKLRTRDAAENVNLKLDRIANNPIIKPNNKNAWEAFNTFNPTAVYAGGKVHILYRAQGFDYVSVVGYASSRDGIHIDKQFDEPAYFPKEPFEYTGSVKPENISHFYMSGGGFGGIEDPRATIIGDRVYMVYVAFDGVSPPRIALTSIALDDLLNHRWMWERAVLISPPGIVDKSAVIFPEKVNGKYVIMHRVFPDILVDYVDDLNFDGTSWLEGKYHIPPRPKMWDSRKIGAGAPPIKTKDGWLLIYYATCDQEGASRYLIGAMLLDLNDPTKVLHRSKLPILKPMEDYENVGFKAGVVYPCGAVVIGETLFVYYGGADSYVCVATANLQTFLKQLQFSETPVLEPAIVSKIL
jgi:predicted GH43/DUF377 family glycosyl hydrolase